jgi:hypothetical protein
MTVENNVADPELTVSLKAGKVSVKFTKVDGTERVMNCTLSENLLPSDAFASKAENERPHNPEVTPVWDLDKNAWRCFRNDSVLEWSEI